MSANDLTLGAEFPEASRADWAALAEKALAGAPLEKLSHRTDDGIVVDPLYLAADWPAAGDPSGFPGAAPFARGGRVEGAVREGWGIDVLQSHPDPSAANRAILNDLERGATGVVLRFDRAACFGGEPVLDGVLIASVDDLDTSLKGVLLDLAPVRLQAGARFFPAAAMLAAVWKRRGLDPAAAKGSFGADPIGALAEAGRLDADIETLLEAAAALAQHAVGNCPGVTAFSVDASLPHAAGATDAQELGYAIATGLLYLRAMVASGVNVDAACRQIEFTLTADENFFGTIARLRAARMLWARVAELCGASHDARAMRLRAVTAERMMTRRDPWVNLLRTTSACFAAGVAGAEAVTVLPYNAALGLPDGFARRIARNTQIILQEESVLNRVIDPAGGSWYVERLTEALAEAGWREFQAIQATAASSKRCSRASCRSASPRRLRPRERNVARRKVPIVGVNEFPHLREAPVEVEPLRNRRSGRTRPNGCAIS
jgi:methylmalonyl-CoA mutase